MDETRKTAQILSGFTLKLLAMIFMTLDHVGIFLLHNDPFNTAGTVLRVIGRLAFPLFCFFLAEGMRYTRSKEKYLLRIGAMYAVITLGETLLVYVLKQGYSPDTLAPMPFTDLFFSMLALYCLLLPKWKKVFAIFPIALMSLSFVVDVLERMQNITIHWFPYYLRFGYGLYGLLMLLLFFIAPWLTKKIYGKRVEQAGISMDIFVESPEYRRQTNIISIGGLIVSVILFWAISYIGRGADYAPFDPYGMGMGSYALLAGILLYFYSGRRGYDSKFFRILTYAYFPLHIVILFLIFNYMI